MHNKKKTPLTFSLIGISEYQSEPYGESETTYWIICPLHARLTPFQIKCDSPNAVPGGRGEGGREVPWVAFSRIKLLEEHLLSYRFFFMYMYYIGKPRRVLTPECSVRFMFVL
jgi:hypothetical protein